MAIAIELTTEIDQQRVGARKSLDRTIGSDRLDDRGLEARRTRRRLADAPLVREVHLASSDQCQQRCETPAQRAAGQEVSFDTAEARRGRGATDRNAKRPLRRR